MVSQFNSLALERRVEPVCVYPCAKKEVSTMHSEKRTEGRAGSRRIFPPQFKLQVLEAYRRDTQCRGNQRATARKFGIHRRQIQKWLQAEPALRAALLRRVPQAAPSPPPYSVGSPESARLPSPSPPMLTTTSNLTPIAFAEPIDLSLRRSCSPPQRHIEFQAAAPLAPESSPRKPFKLFRPYDLPDTPQKPRTSAFSIVRCAPCEPWIPYAYPAPLR